MKQATLPARRSTARRSWRTRLLISLFVICALPISTIFRLDSPSAQRGQQRAAPLIAALEWYRQDEGTYPQRLDLLVPDYLAAVPRAGWRYPYSYIVCGSRTAYILGFRSGGHADITPKYWNYSNEPGAWKFGNGGVPPYIGEGSCLPGF